MPVPYKKSSASHERLKTKGEKTRLSILGVSARLFAQRGYDNVAVRDIAVAARLAPSLLMHHFGNKGELYLRTVNYYLNNGQVFMQGATPLLKANPEDKQAAANAIAEAIHIFFELWYGPRRIEHLDRLLLQVMLGHGSVDLSLAIKWIEPLEQIFEDFFARAGNLTPAEADVRMEIFYSHIFYPSLCRPLLLAEHSWDDYPADFLLAWKSVIARNFCLGMNLPAPTFDYHTQPVSAAHATEEPPVPGEENRAAAAPPSPESSAKPRPSGLPERESRRSQPVYPHRAHMTIKSLFNGPKTPVISPRSSPLRPSQILPS